MTEFKEVKVQRILNPTSIDLGDFVVNPFMGCQYACLYCYARGMRAVCRSGRTWGEFVDIRVNAPELLERELSRKKPETVLLGSTTECFQPAELKCRLTGRILEVLNRNRTGYVILTRSPLILEYLPLLKEGYCRRIYFTVNSYGPGIKAGLEPRSPDFSAREDAVNRLLSEGVPVIPYFSPLLPWISGTAGVFSRFPGAQRLEFECLNFRLDNIGDIIGAIAGAEPALGRSYGRMLTDRAFYSSVWKEIEKSIAQEAKSAEKMYNMYVHAFGDYFKNSYAR